MSAIIFFISFFVVIFLAGYSYESYIWNCGVCKKSGKRWKYFDTDSQGSRGYTDGEYNYCWISYPGIDRNYKNERV